MVSSPSPVFVTAVSASLIFFYISSYFFFEGYIFYTFLSFVPACLAGQLFLNAGGGGLYSNSSSADSAGHVSGGPLYLSPIFSQTER